MAEELHPDGDAERHEAGRRRTSVLVVLGLLLVAQGAWSFSTYPEPYPSVQMPGFGTAATADGTFTVDVLDVTIVDADGSGTPVEVTELMEGFRDSSARPSLSQVFWPDADNEPTATDRRVTNHLADRARAIGGEGVVGLVVRRCQAELDIATAERLSEESCREGRMTW